MRAGDFDVIYSHWFPLPALSRTGVPFPTTMHGPARPSGLSDVIRAFPNAAFVLISDNQRRPLPDPKTIQFGLPSDLFGPSYARGAYLAFLGRLTAEKGPEDAMRIASAARMPRRSRPAKIPRAEASYFEKKLVPSIDGGEIQLSVRWTKSGSSRSSPRSPPCCFPSSGRSRSGSP